MDGSGAIDFVEFYGLWFSLTRPNEVTLQEVKDILRKRYSLYSDLDATKFDIGCHSRILQA